MRKLLFLFTITTMSFAVTAQSIKSRPLKKVMSITMPRTLDDDMPGTRGASVTWHPIQKKYYAAMAGNMGYPLGVYDATGKKLSPDDLSCGADTRGLWYNAQKKELQGNAYGEGGWFIHKLDAKGMVTGTDIFQEGQNQPDGQSVAAYNPSKKELIFLLDGFVHFYSVLDGNAGDSKSISWGLSKKDGAPDEEAMETPEDYNYTTVIYTGIKGSELGFLNVSTREIELYNIADGFLTAKLALPDTASAEQSFNFAFANGMYWLFNMEERIWTAYK